MWLVADGESGFPKSTKSRRASPCAETTKSPKTASSPPAISWYGFASSERTPAVAFQRSIRVPPVGIARRRSTPAEVTNAATASLVTGAAAGVGVNAPSTPALVTGTRIAKPFWNVA